MASACFEEVRLRKMPQQISKELMGGSCEEIDTNEEVVTMLVVVKRAVTGALTPVGRDTTSHMHNSSVIKMLLLLE